MEGERTCEIRILMLEDNPDDVLLAQGMLSKSGINYTMRIIDTEDELKSEELTHYDLVLCDYNLTDYDGLRSVQYIRKHTDIPIIIVSGSISEEMGYELLEAGAQEFVKKSCLKILPHIIKKSLAHQELKNRSAECERMYEETSQMFDTLFDSLENPVFIKDTEGRYRRVNAAFCRLYERSEAELIGRSDEELNWIHASEKSIRDDRFILDKGVSSNYELNYLNEKGERVWLEVTKNPIFTNGTIAGILGQARDITKSKNAIAIMEKSQFVLYQTEELTRAGSFEYDVDLDLVTCSKNLMKMLGLHANQISLSRLVRLIKKEDRTIFLDGINNSIETKLEYRMEHRYMLNEKNQGHFEILFRPDYRDETGNTFYGIIVDITEESKENISRLEYHEESKNEIARELHDNLGQKLNAASMYLGKVMSCNDCTSVISKATDVLHEGINDLGRLITGISLKEIDDISLQYALEKLTDCLPDGMHVNFECNIDESAISKFVKRQVFRVVQETVNNAVKYSQAKNLTITINHEGSILNMIVEDDGNGFDILTATKGNGLINITHRVKKSNGLINIDSRRGEGTKVMVKMPVA
ncbi:PAS domain S-box protein [Ekhidna sp.]|uniref:hybrid sensor histidine kinase/response regulator n=1 Tax=Ekhidna sp. TaxID=2608089 RepID=UPI003B5CD95D